MNADGEKISRHQEIRPFPYLSGVFTYIEDYHLMGHKIGRKVGDMLELIVLGKIYGDPELKKRVLTEPGILGETGAKHKVEFGFFEDSEKKPDGKPFGIIECKKVGVEVTKNALVRSGLLKLEKGEQIKTSACPNWSDTSADATLKVLGIYDNEAKIEVKNSHGYVEEMRVKVGDDFKVGLTEKCDAFLLEPQQSLRDTDDLVRFCRSVHLHEINDTVTKWGVYDYLTGPQTIEKAKQASLVAMDARKRVDGKWGKDDLDESEKTLLSILVLTEASHWEHKSRQVVTTCIDHNIIVPDEIIIESFKKFENKFGIEKMLPYITKYRYTTDKNVQKIIDEVLKEYEGKVFYDLDLGSYVDLRYDEGKLKVVNL